MPPPPQIPAARFSRRIAAIAAICAGVLGCAGIAIKATSIVSDPVTDEIGFLNRLPTMFRYGVFTPVGILLLAVSMFGLARAKGGIARSVAAFAGLFEAVRWIVVVSGKDTSVSIYDVTDLNCVLLSFAAVTLDIPGRPSSVARASAAGASLLSLFILACFGLDVIPYPGFTHLPAPVLEALAYVLLAVSVHLARPDLGLTALAFAEDAGGLVLRRLLPASLLIPALACLLLLFTDWNPAFSVAVLAVSTLAAMGIVAHASAAALARVDAERRERAEALLSLNADLERRVLSRTADLENANRELEAFCASVSHDLRGPLLTIDGFSAALDGPELDPEKRRLLLRIRSGVERMGTLIETVLEMSRLARADLATEPVDLSAMATAIVAELAAAEPGRRVEVKIQPGLRAQGDPALLRVALHNLLHNAWKFTGLRADAVVDFGGNGTGEYFVRDNGAGFPPAAADKLFGLFRRLHDASEFPGHGVGLASTQRIIQRHGGTIRAESTPGSGATFYFTLKG